MKCMHMTRFVVREMLVMRHYHVDATSQQVVIRELARHLQAPCRCCGVEFDSVFLGHLMSRRTVILFAKCHSPLNTAWIPYEIYGRIQLKKGHSVHPTALVDNLHTD